MKPLNNILNKKVLIICNSDGPAWNRIYCSFFIGKIVEYCPEDNTIIIENKNKDKKTYILLDGKNPFNNATNYNIYDNRFAYWHSDDINHKQWYHVFIGDNALTILRNNIKQSRSQYVYKSCGLSPFSYGRKTKKRFLRDLLDELEKNYQ